MRIAHVWAAKPQGLQKLQQRGEAPVVLNRGPLGLAALVVGPPTVALPTSYLYDKNRRTNGKLDQQGPAEMTTCVAAAEEETCAASAHLAIHQECIEPACSSSTTQ